MTSSFLVDLCFTGEKTVFASSITNDMTNYLLKISRAVFNLLTRFDDLLRYEEMIARELKGIKDLLSDNRNKNPEEDFLTVEDLALKLQVTKRTIYKWEKAGRFDSVRLGSKRYYNPSDF